MTLSKSERVENTSSGNVQAAPCGVGSRPQFEVVVFFERSGAGAGALSAAAEPLPAAGNATASATPGAAATPAAGTQPASATPAPTATPAP